LKEQLKHLILTGSFGVGDRLPSIRALAGFLRVNRNTVARVISDLEREGFVESRRGSGVYVVRPPVDEEELRRQEVLERVMDLAAAQGIAVEDLGNMLLARAGVRPQEKVKILFVECTGEELHEFSDELEEQLPVEVERVLLEDLPARLEGEENLPWQMAVTTFFHVHEVQDLVGPFGIETVALLAEANIESLRRLTELPSGTPVGVVGWGRTCMENLSRSLEGAGLDHLDFRSVYIDQGSTEEILSALDGVQAVACATITAKKLRELGVPEELEIIEEDRTLDKGRHRDARPHAPAASANRAGRRARS
jgi:GntR family transcriptional regulator